MKSIQCTLGLVVLCLAGLTSESRAIDISQNISLDRYTLIDGDTFEYDQGYLRPSGQFEVVTSEIDYYSFSGLTPDYIAPFSGKPLMDEELFDYYHSMKLIPKWLRSQADFEIGYEMFVIVAVSGKGDPNPAITIYDQPESQQVLAGWDAVFFVEADPIAYLSYQWYFKNRPIPGETYSSILITNVTAAEAGLYKLALTTGSKPIFSKSALLQVAKPVSIKTEPKSQTVKAGRNATFRVTAGGTAPFTYQWYLGDWSSPISGATNSFYVIRKAESTNAGMYVVMVYNSLSGAPSEPAVLTVTP